MHLLSFPLISPAPEHIIKLTPSYLSIFLTLNGQFNCNPDISYIIILGPYLFLFSAVAVIQIRRQLVCSTEASQGVEEL